MGAVFIAMTLVLWLIAMWAMVMMLTTTLKNRDQFRLGWLLVGTFVLEPYNRKYFWTFAGALAVWAAIVILYIVLVGP